MKIFTKLLHLIGIHYWKFSHESGIYQYAECKICGKRDYRKLVDMHGVLDREWLTRGKTKNLSTENPPTESGLRE